MNGYITPEALNWLSTVLAERYGHPLRLDAEEEGARLRVSLPGSDRIITIAADSRTFARADSDLPFTRWDATAEGWLPPIDSHIPAPGIDRLPSPLVVSNADGYHIGYDILGLVYWMLTRQEEVGRADLDEHGRFPATASHAFKHDYLERPVVDEWLVILRQIIERTWPGIALAHHQFRLRLSHDVDRPSRYGFGGFRHLIRTLGGDLLKRRDLAALMRALPSWWATPHSLHPLDPYNTFEWIMDLSEACDLQSAFYFICGRTHPQFDGRYEIEDPAIRKLLRRIHARGHEIGLHPSYDTYLNPAVLSAEANRLRQVCAQEGIEQVAWGGRMHYLRWKQPDTLNAWKQAGMAYDSTLGYADQAGFRCGTCHEFSAFDPRSKRSFDLKIRPLIVMEATVLSSKYMNATSDSDAFSIFERLAEKCQKVNGTFCMLWHNSELQEKRSRNLYSEVVRRINS